VRWLPWPKRVAVSSCPGIAVKEWLHQPTDPKAKARRHIVVRK